MLQLASLILPPKARARRIEEWRRDVEELPPSERRRYILENLQGIPELAFTEWFPLRRRQ